MTTKNGGTVPMGTEDKLIDLHGVVCDVLNKELTKDRGGEDVPAATLQAAIAFLKNNGIDSTIANKRLKALKGAADKPASLPVIDVQDKEFDGEEDRPW